MKLSITCYNPVQAHNEVTNTLWPALKSMLMAGHKMVIELKPETRSLEQNKRLWAMLTDISQQVEWYGKKLSPEDWKHVFTSSLKKLEVVPNIEGTGFVALGLSTSKMTRQEMCDMQELITAFGAERGVIFHDIS